MSFRQIYEINIFNMDLILYVGLFVMIIFIAIITFNVRTRNKNPYRIVPALLFLILFEILGISKHFGYLNCLKNGNFETVEGQVDRFIPGRKSTKGIEIIELNGKTFSYSLFSINGGLNDSVAENVKEGVYVRISYKDNAILRFEVNQ